MTLLRTDFFRLLATLLYAFGYHMMYVEYLNPVFEYAHYRLESRGWIEWGFIYFIALLPAIWQRGKNNAIAAGVSLIYLLLYVPALITMCAMWILPFSSFAVLSISLLIGQLIIQFSIRWKSSAAPVPEKFNQEIFHKQALRILLFFTAISLSVLIYENLEHMRLVSFEDVYDLRFASRDSSSLLGGYLTMWLLGVSIPYFLAISVKGRNWKFTVLAVALSVTIYMANGAKGALLMPILGALVGLSIQHNRDSTSILAMFLAALMWVLFLLDFEWLNLAKSLFLMRLLSTAGWTMTTYYEFFSSNGFTYYSHVGPIGALIGKSYNLELGRLIGWEYFNSEEVNLNANFWASDGIAALGSIGVIISSILMAFILKAFFTVSRHGDQRAVAILFSGFWLSILNGSLFTSMLSGGGFLLYFLFLFSNFHLKTKDIHHHNRWA